MHIFKWLIGLKYLLYKVAQTECDVLHLLSPCIHMQLSDVALLVTPVLRGGIARFKKGPLWDTLPGQIPALPPASSVTWSKLYSKSQLLVFCFNL